MSSDSPKRSLSQLNGLTGHHLAFADFFPDLGAGVLTAAGTFGIGNVGFIWYLGGVPATKTNCQASHR